MFAARVKRTLRFCDGRYMNIELLLRTKDKPTQGLFDLVHRVLELFVDTPPLQLAELAEHIRHELCTATAIESDASNQFYIEWIKVIEESPDTIRRTSNEVCFIVPLPIPEGSAVPIRGETPE